MTKVAILGADLFDDRREQAIFQSAQMEAVYYSCRDPLDIVSSLTDADALMINLERVTRDLLDRLPNVKVIGRYGVGVDNIDLRAASDHGVAVIHVPDYCIDEVAEHAVSLIFAANRKLFQSARLTQIGVWGKVKELKPIRPIKDVCLGVVGTGRIGMKVIEMMLPFGTSILVFDPYVKPDSLPVGVKLASELDELFERADILTIHCPLTEQTRHLFNTAAFERMKRKPAIVNVSRGPIINEAELLRALDDGIVSFAALDVLETEPPQPDHPLLHHAKAVVSSHIAWYSEQAEIKLRDLLTARVIDYLNGKPVQTIVNRKDLSL